MKRIKILNIILILLLLFTTHVYAAGPQLSLVGDSTIKPGETKTISLQLSSDVSIGNVTGKIKTSSNVKDLKISAISAWTLEIIGVSTWNPETGDFTALNAYGTNSGGVLNIEYTVADTEGTATIELKELVVSKVGGDDIELNDISKQITIKKDQSPENPPEDDEVTLTGIKVTKAPTKTTYTVGEKFDKTGMVVKAEYSDKTTKEITNYTYEPQGELKETDKKITISYTEKGVTKTTEQAITVVEKPSDDEEKTLSEIIIEKAPTKTEYTVGEKFDKTGMVVKAKYSDGSSKEITDYKYSPEGELKETDAKITISYTEKEVTKTIEQNITVKKAVEPEDEKKQENKKDETTSGEGFPKAGLSTGILVAMVIMGAISGIILIKNKKYKDIR